MSKKMYVGNLAFTVTEGHLSEYFAQFGKVASVQLITDRATGRSKGFGFVEMASDAEAQTAIQKTNGQDWGGRRLTVNEARPKEDFKPGSSRPHPSTNGHHTSPAPRPRHFEPRETRVESSYHNYSAQESHSDLPPAEVPHFGKNAGHRHRDRDREKERDKMRSGRGR